MAGIGSTVIQADRLLAGLHLRLAFSKEIAGCRLFIYSDLHSFSLRDRFMLFLLYGIHLFCFTIISLAY